MKIPIRYKQESLLIALYVLSIFVSLVPFFLQGMSIVIRLFFIIGMSSGVMLAERTVNYKKYLISVVYLILMILIYLPRHQFTPIFNYNLLLVVPMLYMNERVISKSFLLFSKIFALFLIPAVIVNLLLYFNIDIPYKISNYVVENKADSGYYYIERFGSILIAPNALETRFPRLIGFLDEPGYTATLIFFLLLGNRFDLRKWFNVILLFAAIMTLSLAFFILSILYLFFRVSLKYKIYTIISVFAIVMIVKNSNYELYFKETTTERLSEFLKGQDNRIGSGSYAKEVNKVAGSLSLESLFGKGYLSVLLIDNIEKGTGTLHWTYWLLDFGYIGIFIILSFYLLLTSIFNRGVTGWFFIFLFLLSVYQRPLIFHSFYFFILIGGLINIKFLSENRLNLIYK